MKAKLSLFIVMVFTLALVCLLFTSCGQPKENTANNDQTTAAQETAEEPKAEEKEDASQDSEKEDAEEKKKAEKEDKKEAAKEDQKAEEAKKADQTNTETKSDKKAKKTSSNNKKDKTKKTKKVWVEPVYETHTVDTGLGTTYCNGANSGGGCGASWHGTKEATYQSWKSHWQAYVKKRTAEEAAKGKTYVCDHIHDDCRWVADPPKQEKVLVKKGYWKTVSE